MSKTARLAWSMVAVLSVLGQPGVAQAGKLAWLDDVVHEVILETRTGGKRLIRGGDGARAELHGAGRLFLSHNADETLENLVRRSDELARAGRRVEQQIGRAHV